MENVDQLRRKLVTEKREARIRWAARNLKGIDREESLRIYTEDIRAATERCETATLAYRLHWKAVGREETAEATRQHQREHGKKCKQCEEVKVVTDFYLNHEGIAVGYCKSCTKQGAINYQKANQKKIAAQRKCRTYGITQEDLEALEEHQEGKCAICGEKKRLVVDHCHDSGAVRGLLCHTCNGGIGMLKDDPDVIRAAATYLERYKDKLRVLKT